MKSIRTIGLFAILAWLIAVVVIVGRGPVVDIRVDCGDLRYKYLGVPVWYESIGEPRRTILLSIAAASGKVEHVWVPVVPQTTSYCIICEYKQWYRDTADWATADKTISRLMLEELSKNIINARGVEKAGVQSIFLMKCMAFNEGVVPADWTDYSEVRKYCELRGYIRPEWLPKATAGTRGGATLPFTLPPGPEKTTPPKTPAPPP